MDISVKWSLTIPCFINVLGVRTNIIGLIEGIGGNPVVLKVFPDGSPTESAAAWLAVFGYGLSALSKPFFWFANSWKFVAGIRWAGVGKAFARLATLLSL